MSKRPGDQIQPSDQFLLAIGLCYQSYCLIKSVVAHHNKALHWASAEEAEEFSGRSVLACEVEEQQPKRNHIQSQSRAQDGLHPAAGRREERRGEKRGKERRGEKRDQEERRKGKRQRGEEGEEGQGKE
ncbi:hypothetical protein WMY93_028037 [Mugilogobius chulae]|uniref:Uncharacterized protein n=1 Tax=Mugilogobius chulae TaxID=88201 RepID=A0AAW0N720_9GOBI